MMTSFQKISQVKKVIDDIKANKPTIYSKFINIVQLTRQLQYRFQYMGALILEEEAKKYEPAHQNAYVMRLYMQEINKFKEDENAWVIQNLLADYKELGYATISRLALGTNPRILIGPVVIH
ncbi:hypothetical protein P5G51_002190 [Virgibacillus sp. 179-BFC.A HS]|uniref:Uncharacterized protein n=1 Tax=Tigheibacillus jepli TaxID=3035914 RepID=A0ABU5CDI4_9BACI|nr:hypothetical protein [Virgibacillus sp. 179-BFC.A HS]MDY0404383.1 hypothetical protein [Virgibacillus sp. 179-BFC.A HS]